MAFGVWVESSTRHVHKEAQLDHFRSHQVRLSLRNSVSLYFAASFLMDLLFYAADVQSWLEDCSP